MPLSGFRLNKKYIDTVLLSKDKKFKLWFHPLRIYFNSIHDPGLILEEKMDDEFKPIHYVPYNDGNWHEMECTMLNNVDELDYDNDTKKCIREFIWNEIISKTRESFENE